MRKPAENGFAEHPNIEIPTAVVAGLAMRDVSWHNDACARMERTFGPEVDGEPSWLVVLWVDRADRDAREWDMGRFNVLAGTPADLRGDHPASYSGEDAAAAREALAAAIAHATTLHPEV